MMGPVIVVAGLGRCGTSLVMQMLAAAGVSTIGTYPDFEDSLNMRLPDLDAQREFWERCPGHAVKLIDPHLRQPPIGLDYRCIFLTRHPREQAKSMIKMAAMAAEAPLSSDRRARRAMEGRIRRDTSRARLAIERMGGGRYLQLSFEEIIHDSLMAASRIALWVGVRGIEAERMARCVRRRTATCLPYMMEMELIAHG